MRSSNAAFFIQLTDWNDTGWAVSKPESGERPLFDFEPGLFRREQAAYLLSEHLGWGLVPRTVTRDDAPLGVGSLQWFIECDGREHYFTLYEDQPETHPVLAQIALFDCIANITDRKSGHVLLGNGGRVWGIDHGLCFAADFKLRTVIWDFAGDPIPDALLADIAALLDGVEVAGMLSDRTRTRRRRRQPRLLGGMVVLALGLAWVALSQDQLSLTLAWVPCQVATNATPAAMMASFAGNVPNFQRGTGSSTIAVAPNAAILAGIYLAVFLVGNLPVHFIAPGILAVVLVFVYCFPMRDEVPKQKMAPLKVTSIVSSFWTNPSRIPTMDLPGGHVSSSSCPS